ncbi:hypothetical protein KSS87_015574, partial [Heliosperma pusillum]
HLMGKEGNQDIFNKYERIRNERIAQNKTKLQEFGVHNISKSLSGLVKSTKSNKMVEKKNMISNDTVGEKDYIPPCNGESGYSIRRSSSGTIYSTKFKEHEIDKYRDDLHDSKDEGSSDSVAEFYNKLAKDVPELEQEAIEDESEEVDLDSRDFDLDVMTEEKTRGPTMLHDVHMRPYKKRKAIFLNEFGQPIGPITEKEDTVSEFSLFLGTIARDYGYAPLVYNTWRKMPNKEKMWDYVLLNYIVPEEGKNWVLRTIGAAWRIHKCRFKRKHYYSYKDDKTRWQNKSKRVLDENFINLLAKWKKKTEKEDMKNYVPLEDGSCPSDAFLGVMGKEYDGRRRLYGRVVCNKKLKNINFSTTPYVVPGDQVMESLKTDLYQEIRKDMDCEFTRLEDKSRAIEEQL